MEGRQPVAGRRYRFRAESSGRLATGTLACPSCDAPLLPGPLAMSPSDPLSCGYCDEAGAVRDFLSLARPTRPTRVIVRVRGPAIR